MVSYRMLDVRWIWRYRLFYTAGIIIMSSQIFLAVIFFTLYEETDKNSNEILNKNFYVLDQNEESNLKDNKPANYNEKNIAQVENELFSEYAKDKHTVKNIKENFLIFNQISHNETTGISEICNISGKDFISAINRARTTYCKQLLVNTTCLLQNDQLFPSKLPHSCFTNNMHFGKHLGCYRDSATNRLLSGSYYNLSSLNSQSYCLNRCLLAGFSFAGVEFGDECFCGNEKPRAVSRLAHTSCNMKCPSNATQNCGGYFSVNVFETGISKFSPQIINDPNSYNNNDLNEPVRIVFLLTLNGRSVRQVYRLIKTLFHRDHFFFIHVDARQDYLFRELLPLELKLPNLRLSRRRYSTIWGGASLLTMLLQSMSELIQSSWEWDFVINLSESDFPIKSNKDLVAFLSANRNRNFVKSHGRDVYHFIHKQGLDKTFVECDEHMWRIGNKILPTGIVIDGGSDWVALSQPFINYIVTAQNDELLDGLKIIFKYTLLPAESFFHTVLRNSIFCNTYIDNNLHVTNWKRHLGCKCQYKHVVDWCGCSPNVFTMDDWSRIQNTANKSLFFARKFDPIVSQSVINKLEEWLYGKNIEELKNWKKYWQNIYHYLDRRTDTDDVTVTVGSSLSRFTFNLLLKNELMCSSLKNNKLLQVHSFFENDAQRGILIHFDSLSTDRELVQFQAWFELLPSFTIFNISELALRFINLVVSTNYDAKEKMSRNYISVAGPMSEPILIYQISSGTTIPNITVAWVDPLQKIVDVNEITLEENLGIYSLKSNLRKPLIPGIWKVYLIYNFTSLARIMFTVMPIETALPNDGIQEIRSQSNSVSVSEWHYLQSVIESVENKFGNSHALHNNVFNVSSFTKTELLELIDDLTNKTFKMVNYCIVSTKTKVAYSQSNCFYKNFQQCHLSNWSSFSPDPKAYFSTINKLTGRLI